jgi:hypothetical protein
MWEGNFVPPQIPNWSDAIQTISSGSRRLRELRKGVRDAGYFFPDPGLFLGVSQEWKAADWLSQWVHVKNVWLLRTYSPTASPLSPQEWRDILSLGFLKEQSGQDKVSVTGNAVEKVRGLIGDCLKAAGVVERSLTRPRPQCAIGEQVVDLQRARVILWELCELNFRWELRALDRRLYNKPSNNPLNRHHMLMECFAYDLYSIASVRPSKARSGLASPSFADRLPYLQALWRLMSDWPGDKPSNWFSVPCVPTVTPENERWERVVAQFYAQTFFDHFHRPPILPHTLGTNNIQ